MTQAGRAGSHFHWQGTKRTSLSLGWQPERPPALQVQWEKREDVTFPKTAEVRRPISHSHTHTQEGGNDGLSVALVLVRRCVSVAA